MGANEIDTFRVWRAATILKFFTLIYINTLAGGIQSKSFRAIAPK